MRLPVSKLFAVSILSFLFLAQLLPFLNSSPVSAQSNLFNCNYKITYTSGPQSGQEVTNNQIVVGWKFTLQASTTDDEGRPPTIGHSLELVIQGNQVPGGKRDFAFTTGTVSVSSDQIFDGKLPTDTNDLLILDVAFQNSGGVCKNGSVDFEYVKEGDQSSCIGSLALESNATKIKSTAKDCKDKKIKLEFELVRGSIFIKDKIFEETVNSDNWDKTVTIADYKRDGESYERASLYIDGKLVDRQEFKILGACPSFYSYNPPSPKPADNVQVQYNPIFADINGFRVVVVRNEDRANGRTEHQLVSAFNKWVASIGSFSPGTKVWIILTRYDGDPNTIDEQCDLKEEVMSSGGFNPKDVSEFDASCVEDSGKTRTTFGCIARNPTALVNTLLPIAIGAGGGIAFLLIVYGGFRLATSQGDPKAVQDAREIITGAIVGLMIIILSVFILRLVGIDILGLPI